MCSGIFFGSPYGTGLNLHNMSPAEEQVWGKIPADPGGDSCIGDS